MTGMSLSRAFWIGLLKATGSTTETAMPAALPEMAVSMASTMSLTTEFSEPVHCDVVPSSASASSMPYRVGTKKGLVVTWLIKTKFHSGVSGKLPPDPPPPPPACCAASRRHPASNNPAEASALPARNCLRPSLKSPSPLPRIHAHSSATPVRSFHYRATPAGHCHTTPYACQACPCVARYVSPPWSHQ